MSTRDKRKWLSYLVIPKLQHIANYHNNLLKGLRTVMVVMGVASSDELSKRNVAFRNKQGKNIFDVDQHYNKDIPLQMICVYRLNLWRIGIG